MSHYIVDRRKSDKNKSLTNRKRFLDRVKDSLKESVKDIIIHSNIDEVLSSKRKKITVPGKGLNKPNFNYNPSGGVNDYILVGNDRFHEGDKIAKPPSEDDDGVGNGEGSGDGEGEDSFEFTLSKEEFMDIFFEDLELPNLVRKEIADVEEVIPKRAGLTTDGPPSRLHILKSMHQSKSRRLALRLPKQRKLKELEEQLSRLLIEYDMYPSSELVETINNLKNNIEVLKRKIKAVPFLDDTDLRYRRWENHPVPSTKAVIFAVMDVSGSMGEWEKEMAKRFFIYLIWFLHYNYEKVEIRWIRHHSTAREVNEQSFFNDKDNGGTIVSSAYQLINKIIEEEYPANAWNIFISQISDGDNMTTDNHDMLEILTKKLLPIVQYFTYVETRKVQDRLNMFGISASTLFQIFENVEKTHENFKASVVSDASMIYPIFRKLFEKKIKNAN